MQRVERNENENREKETERDGIETAARIFADWLRWMDGQTDGEDEICFVILYCAML